MAHRNALLDIKRHNIATFDKAIITLSSGSFALSLLFIDKIGGIGSTELEYLLLFSWTSYLISIISNLISYRVGWKEVDLQIKAQDEHLRTEKNFDYTDQKNRDLTSKLNDVSLIFFVAGTIILCAFTYMNIGDSSERQKITTTSTTVASP